jgi:hypothetical protein
MLGNLLGWSKVLFKETGHITYESVRFGIKYEYGGGDYGRSQFSVIITDAQALEPVQVLEIPDNVEGMPVVRILPHVFQNTYFRSIHLPSNLNWIMMEAFCGCRELRCVRFPWKVHIIDTSAFENCSHLESVEFEPPPPDAHLRFRYDELKSRYGEGVSPEWRELFPTELGNRVFAGCLSLKSITLPDKVLVNKNAFENCVNLKSISIPAGLDNTAEWGLPPDCKISIRNA